MKALFRFLDGDAEHNFRGTETSITFFYVLSIAFRLVKQFQFSNDRGLGTRYWRHSQRDLLVRLNCSVSFRCVLFVASNRVRSLYIFFSSVLKEVG